MATGKVTITLALVLAKYFLCYRKAITGTRILNNQQLVPYILKFTYEYVKNNY